MRRFVSLLVLIAVLFSAQPAVAQSPLQFASVAVQIWPEYDKPDVLVIYYIRLAEGTPLPTEVNLRIPAGAKSPHVVAVGATPETVSDVGVKFNVTPQGKWINVAIQASGGSIQLEYYDPSLVKNGRDRRFTYEWPADYATQNFSVSLQQPFDASEVNTDPGLTDVSSSPNGLTYHDRIFGALEAGKPLGVSIEYQKASDALSISFMPVEPSAPLDENTPGRISIGTFTPWLLTAILILVLAGGFYIYMRGPRQPRRAHKHKAAKAESPTADVYCHQCGARSHAGDRFCRTCGTRLRVEAEN